MHVRTHKTRTHAARRAGDGLDSPDLAAHLHAHAHGHGHAPHHASWDGAPGGQPSGSGSSSLSGGGGGLPGSPEGGQAQGLLQHAGLLQGGAEQPPRQHAHNSSNLLLQRRSAKLLRLGLLMAVTMTLHNMPEVRAGCRAWAVDGGGGMYSIKACGE